MAVSVSAGRSLRSSLGVRNAAICGILWPLLSIVRLPLTGEFDRPDWTASPSSIIDFYENTSFDGAFVVGIGLVALAYRFSSYSSPNWLPSSGNTRRGAPWLGNSVLAFNIVNVGFTAGYLASFASAVFWSSHGGLSGDAYLTLHGLSFGSYWFALPTDLLANLALGGAIVATRLFPRWLGWAMILTGLAEAVSWFFSPDVWNATSGLPYLWILIAAVIMLVRSDRYTSPGLSS